MDFKIDLKFMDLIQPGKILRFENRVIKKTEIYYFLAIVDVDQVVYKKWTHNRWVYFVKWAYLLQMDYESGRLHE